MKKLQIAIKKETGRYEKIVKYQEEQTKRLQKEFGKTLEDMQSRYEKQMKHMEKKGCCTGGRTQKRIKTKK